MKIRTAIYSAVACGALTISATAMGQAAPPTPSPMQEAANQLASGDKDFMENAAQAGHTEIEGSKLAQTHAKSADVKAFADQMIKDHTKVGEELTELAKSKGYVVPTGPSLMQKATLKTLDMRDESFDEKYATQIGVSAHEDAVKLFQKAATEGRDPDIKAFAVKTLPSLEQHLEMAKALKQKVSSNK